MRGVLRALKWMGIAVFALLLGGLVFALIRFGPVPLTLAWADYEPNGPEASPAIGASFSREDALRTLGEEVYGAWPDASATRVLNRSTREWRGHTLLTVSLEADATFGEQTRTTRPFTVSLVAPAPDAPLVLWASFSPRGDAFRAAGLPETDMPEVAEGALHFVFGRYIQTPPVESILAAGYGLAVVHPPEFLPDNSNSVAELERLASGHGDPDTRWGAVAAWAWGMSCVLDALDWPAPVIAAGHSRYGKAALLAAAHDRRFAGAVAHQSGTGGASLSKAKRGESVADITASYPHWFAPSYRESALSVDQHHLLAAVAPRPVLLGNARRDVWSDPNGALRAARGASEAYGIPPPERLPDGFGDYDPTPPLALWMRPGTHGIVEEDWPAFLQWMRAHFPAQGWLPTEP